MADYIERETAIRTVTQAVDSGIVATSEDLHEVMENMPAADVAPVVHGRWVNEECGFAECSLCGESLEVEFTKHNYCPNCGAKMDGE